ncbi:MAG: glycosyltransferase family 2 protein, partial [Candidatus Omnitrophica bacterium]|nr:glycosyltransferase family 2 protein [Candidatus Omnitrophota bacterium]
VASRRVTGALIYNYPWYRHVMARVFNGIVRLVLLPGIRDTQCGFKGFRRQIVHVLFDRLHISSLAFDVELLYKARLSGYRIMEIPVVWTNSKASKVHLIGDSWRMLRDVMWIYQHYSRKKP